MDKKLKKTVVLTNIIGIIGLTLLLVIDQVTKSIAVNTLMGKKNIVLIKGVLELSYVENRGAAFGVMKNATFLFLTVSILVLLVIIFYYEYLPFLKRFSYIRVLFVFISAGALGNLIDRILHKYVIDFIYFKLIDFPVFNVADIYVTCSIIVLLVLMLFYYKDSDIDAFKIRKNK